MALTKKDIEKLSDVFATKEDLKRFATKEDLKRFATKEDLKRFATKEEMDARFRQVDVRFEQMEARISKQFEQVTTTLDWLVGAFQTFREELMVRFAQYRRHDEQLEIHETRIKKLEERVLA